MFSEDWLVSFCFLDLSIPLGFCLKHVPKRAVILLDFLFGNPWAMRSFWLRQRCLFWHIFCGIRYASSKLLISDLNGFDTSWGKFPPKKIISGHRFWETFFKLVCLVCSGVSSQWLPGFWTEFHFTLVFLCVTLTPPGMNDTLFSPSKLYFPYGSPMCNLKKPWKFCHWPSIYFLLGKRSLLTEPNRWCYLIAATWRSCSLKKLLHGHFLTMEQLVLGVFVGIRNKEDRVGKDNFFTHHPFFFDCMSVFTQVGCFCYCFCKLLFLVGKSVTGLANPNSCCKKVLNRCQIRIIGIQEYRLSVKGR